MGGTRVWSLADGLGSVREKADVSPEKMGVGLEACARARGSPPSVRCAGIGALLQRFVTVPRTRKMRGGEDYSLMLCERLQRTR